MYTKNICGWSSLSFDLTWDMATVLFALFKNEVGSGFSCGSTMIGKKSSSETSVSLSVMGQCQPMFLDSVLTTHEAKGQHENTGSQTHEVTRGVGRESHLQLVSSLVFIRSQQFGGSWLASRIACKRNVCISPSYTAW